MTKKEEGKVSITNHYLIISTLDYNNNSIEELYCTLHVYGSLLSYQWPHTGFHTG